MVIKWVFVVTVLLVILFAACTPRNFDPASPSDPIFGAPNPGPAEVESVEIQIVENSPLQVDAVVRGQLPDSACTSIISAHQERDGNTIQVTLETSVDPLARCAPVLTPFEYKVKLNVTGLPPDRYIVTVGGVEQSFEMVTRNNSEFEQQLVEALNTRDFALLELLMDESFTIAVWQSQGSVYESGKGIEQLQISYLNESTQIRSNPDIDLAALINGWDPVSVFGPDADPGHAVFVSGWGLDGQDEAVLYISTLPDGSLYWHGVMVTEGGFDDLDDESYEISDLPVGIQSVLYDTRAEDFENVITQMDSQTRKTNVQFVMAQQDLLIFTLPGMQYSSAGMAGAGQILQVMGVSNGGNWWQVECPDEIANTCWVSAHPSYTKPVRPPG